MKILYITPYNKQEFVGYYRTYNIVSGLKKCGADCDILYLKNNENKLLSGDKLYDVIVFQRTIFSNGIAFFNNVKKHTSFENHSPLMIFDIDDLLWVRELIPEFFQKMNFSFNKEVIEFLLKESDLVTVSTPLLALKAQEFNTNIYVLKNCIEEKFISPKKYSKDEEIIFGFMAGKTHNEEFLWLLDILSEIALTRKIHFRVLGDFNAVSTQKNLKLEIISPVPYENIFDFFRSCSAGLNPRFQGEFNDCKSENRFLEFGAAGVPILSSPRGIFSDILKDNKNAFLASTREEWINKILYLLDHPDILPQAGMNARRTILQNYIPGIIAENFILKIAENMVRLKKGNLFNVIKTLENLSSKSINRQMNSKIKNLISNILDLLKQNNSKKNPA